MLLNTLQVSSMNDVLRDSIRKQKGICGCKPDWKRGESVSTVTLCKYHYGLYIGLTWSGNGSQQEGDNPDHP